MIVIVVRELGDPEFVVKPLAFDILLLEKSFELSFAKVIAQLKSVDLTDDTAGDGLFFFEKITKLMVRVLKRHSEVFETQKSVREGEYLFEIAVSRRARAQKMLERAHM